MVGVDDDGATELPFSVRLLVSTFNANTFDHRQLTEPFFWQTVRGLPMFFSVESPCAQAGTKSHFVVSYPLPGPLKRYPQRAMISGVKPYCVRLCPPIWIPPAWILELSPLPTFARSVALLVVGPKISVGVVDCWP